MNYEETIEPDVFNEWMEYFPCTGVIIWKKSPNPRVKPGDVAGCLNHDGYIVISFKNKMWRAHRIAWLLFYGEWPNNEIDHINHNKADNTIFNLRDVDQRENSRNNTLQGNSTSGIPGVNFNKSDGWWVARIYTNTGRINIGYTKDFFEACCMRKAAEVQHGYHPNHGKTLEGPK